MPRLPACLTALVLTLAVFGAKVARAAETVRVIVPDAANLQYLAFWVARAGGHFAREGITTELVIPPHPMGTTEKVKSAEAEVFVLPPPLLLELAATGVQVIAVANLLANDPINLVVRRAVVDARGMRPDAAIEERVRGLRGLRIGVAPGPPTRLRALLALGPLDATTDVEVILLPGKMQNTAFAEGRVDALYAHTPFLEQALVEQDGVLLVNQSAGEVPALAGQKIHALAVTRHLRDANPALVERLVRAIAAAEREIIDQPARAVAAVRREFPAMSPARVERIVGIYGPAMPRTPEVSAEGLREAVARFPANRVLPDLGRVDLTAHVDSTFAARAAPQAGTVSSGNSEVPHRQTPRRWLRVALAAVALAAAAGAITVWRRRRHGLH